MLNKRILLAGILSIGVITGMFFFYNNVLDPGSGSQAADSADAESNSPPGDISDQGGAGQEVEKKETSGSFLPPTPAAGGPVAQREVNVETDLFHAVFSNRGAVLTSLVLKEFADSSGEPIDLVLSGGEYSDTIEGDHGGRFPFRILFSNPLENKPGSSSQELFSVRQASSGREVVFFRDYLDSLGNSFTLEKTFTFFPGEYLFRLTVSIQPTGLSTGPSAGSKLVEGNPADDGGTRYLYDLTLGPGIGPPYDRLNARTDYRYFTLLGETPRKKNYLTTEDKLREITEEVRWAGFHGQYFAGVVMPGPEVPVGEVFLDSRFLGSSTQPGTVHFTVPFEGAEPRADEYYCFFGPKVPSILALYSSAEKNYPGLEDTEFSQLNPTSSLIGKLTFVFGKILITLRRVVKNYGLAVLLFALLVRLLTSPLSYKNFLTNKKLQALQPELNQIRKKREFNSAKATSKIMAFYRKEQINTLSRLLPLFIQLPIIVALFQLFARSFEFRSAPFIPGWIDTLSQAESIASLPFSIPLLGNSLRILPLVLLVVTVVQVRITQPPGEDTTGTDGTSRGQRIMAYATPILIFLILYHMPSGIVLYWLFYNLLGIGEHFFFEKKYTQEAHSNAGRSTGSGSGSKPEAADL